MHTQAVTWLLMIVCASFVTPAAGQESAPVDDDPVPVLRPILLSETNEPTVRDLREEILILEEGSNFEEPALDESLLNPRRDNGRGRGAPLRASAFWAPSQSVSGQDADLAMIGQRLELSVPAYILPEGKGIGLVMFRVGHLQLETDALLPDTGIAVPNNLWDVSVGTMHMRRLERGWEVGGMLWVGSASDKPFDAFRDYTLTTIGFLNIPTRNKRDSWNFSLFYSPNSQLTFPIPGIAYAWRPSDRLQANIGIPFSLEYRPTETLSLIASYMPLTTGRVFLRQQLGEMWILYGGYEVVNETYFLSDRIDDDERFYIFDQRAVVGLERQLPLGLTLDLSVGYLFDRQLFQGTSFSDNRRDEILVGSGLGGLLQLVWKR